MLNRRHIRGREDLRWEPPPLPDDRLNLLCPAGIGDCCWILSKLHAVAAHRPVTFWLPEGEQQRAGEYLRLCGYDARYLLGLTTRWVWGKPGDPELPQVGTVPVHANRHLERGGMLRDWYPVYPLKHPTPQLPPCPIKGAFVLAFLCHSGYMEGNLDPAQWGMILRRLQERVAPVLLVGAGRDVEFAREVMRGFEPGARTLFDRPLAEVLAAAASPLCRLAFGLAAGPLISAQVGGTPTFMAYPRWLSRMPGTWERFDVLSGWCHTHDLPQAVLRGEVEAMAR